MAQCVSFSQIQPSVQWRNRRGGGPGRQSAPPRDFWPGNFCWRIGKNKARKKGKQLEMEVGKVIKRGEDLFFFFFFPSPLLFTFENSGNLFWVYQNGNFLPGKSSFHAGKKIRKNDFAPSENYACYAPASVVRKLHMKSLEIEDSFLCHHFTNVAALRCTPICDFFFSIPHFSSITDNFTGC